MKILLDMNLSPTWVGFLSREGIESKNLSDVGAYSAADSEIMEWARVHGYAVFAHDLDFSAILAATRSIGPSVILSRRRDVLPDAIGAEIVRVLRRYSTAIAQGAVVSIDERGESSASITDSPWLDATVRGAAPAWVPGHSLSVSAIGLESVAIAP